LTPFHRDDSGNFWTSEAVRSTSTFAYTYPELIGLHGNDTSALINRVNSLYGPNASSPLKRSAEASYVSHSSFSSRGVTGAPSFSGKRQYLANIRVHKFGLDGSFNIYIFLGDGPSLSPRIWSTAPSFIGMTGILSQSNVGTEKQGQDTNGAVPLTAALEAKVRSGALESMREEAVGPYLKRNLRWRIAKVGRPSGIMNIRSSALTMCRLMMRKFP